MQSPLLLLPDAWSEQLRLERWAEPSPRAPMLALTEQAMKTPVSKPPSAPWAARSSGCSESCDLECEQAFTLGLGGEQALTLFEGRRTLRILVIGILGVVIWGIVGFLIGGWPQALLFGFVAGPIMAGFAILPVVMKSKSGRPPRQRG